jgi:hypothetical protein
MNSQRYEPLPIPIPLDYASRLGCDPSHVSHVNKGRRHLRDDQIHLLLEWAETDARLHGLTILDLRQEIKQFLPDICKCCPRDRKKANKRKAQRGQR